MRGFSNHRRTLALILCFLFVAALFLSMIYIVKDSSHECMDGHCPICSQMELVQKTIDQLGSALVLLLFIGSVLFVILIAVFHRTIASVPITLITQNVRMNN